MSNSLLSASQTISGTMGVSSDYDLMTVGTSDTILLIGHADAAVMYQPYRVINAKKAVNFLNSDSKSPLLRAFLQAYNAGCRDIWLYPAAPMSEYEPTVSQRNIANSKSDVNSTSSKWGVDSWGQSVWAEDYTFYSTYHRRLAAAYAILSDYDFVEIIVPVEAVYQDSGDVDFLTQLTDFCRSSFIDTGAVCLGVLGTRFPTAITPTIVDEMINDTRIANLDEGGKFVLIAAGEGTVSVPQMSTTFISSIATSVAALLATANLDRSITGLMLPNISALIGNDLPPDQLERLAQAKINLAVRSTRGRRGYAYQTKLMSDNTVGQNGTDFWSMTQMHIVASIINQIRYLGYTYIGFLGKSGPDKFKEIVRTYLVGLVTNRYIKDFTLRIDNEDRGQRLIVSVSILPIFGVRQITFKVEVGPGK